MPVPAIRRARRGEHGLDRQVDGRRLIVPFLARDLGLEHLPLRAGQTELNRGDHLAGTLSDAHIALRVLPRVAPVGVVTGFLVVARHVEQVL